MAFALNIGRRFNVSSTGRDFAFQIGRHAFYWSREMGWNHDVEFAPGRYKRA